METIYRSCAGLDVHKKTVEACVRCLSEKGKLKSETRQFATMTPDLLRMSDWLASQGVTHVAMESTGVYWKPIFNLMEDRFTLLLVNARHVKQVPGRKTDVKDCQWLAQLLQYGLLRGSFVPPRPQRDLRDLVRHRSQLMGEKGRAANRIQKILEDANIKLASVATDILGVSSRAMIERMIAGESDPTQLAELARSRLRGKMPQLRLALEGKITDHHRFMLGVLWKHLQFLEQLIEELEERIDVMTRPFSEEIDRLKQIPGIERRVAQTLMAEIGPDMAPFPSEAHLASWAGVCPGNNQSAGKRKSGRTTKGSRWLRQALVQAAWGASRSKNTYLAAQYSRLARRRGRKRAAVAVGHSILRIVYHMLKHKLDFQDLGPDYFDRLNPERLQRHLVKRLEALGLRVTIEPRAAA